MIPEYLEKMPFLRPTPAGNLGRIERKSHEARAAGTVYWVMAIEGSTELS